MKLSQKFWYLFRQYFFVRLSLTCIFFGLIFFLIIFFSSHSTKIPVISSISPQSALPGEALIITGRFFSDKKNDSYIEIGGLRLTEQSYLSWTENQIIVVLPINIQDGLVYVFTKYGKSNPKIFTNQAALPVIVRSDVQTSLPFIQNIVQKSAYIGSLITLEGINFGHTRGSSKVYFSWATEKNPRSISAADSVPAQDADFDYELWSDTQILVRVPNGASSGPVFIQTEKGVSNNAMLEVINHSAATKKYFDKKTYVVELSTEITNISADKDSILVLRVPRPIITDNQKAVEISDTMPSPLNSNLSETVVYQHEPGKINDKKINTSITYLVTTNGIETKIYADAVKPYTDNSRLLYSQYTAENDVIFSTHPTITTLVQEIIQTEKNPYIQAKLLYDYMIDNFKLLAEQRDISSFPLDLATTKSGDAYDFAIFYTSLLRSAGIPSIPLSGILINKSLVSQNHWWTSFYIENFGWVPVDIALGAGMDYDAFHTKSVSARDYYFGNLDAQHIIFSYDINNVRQMLTKSNTVYKPKTFALQTIWEESNTKSLNYTSFWANPRVVGIY
ncbi:MAG: transglutaminase domain-containing protein [Treponemataceae bacterium]